MGPSDPRSTDHRQRVNSSGVHLAGVVDWQGRADRAFHRVLKLAEADTIAAPHLAEALQYRPQVEVG